MMDMLTVAYELTSEVKVNQENSLNQKNISTSLHIGMKLLLKPLIALIVLLMIYEVLHLKAWINFCAKVLDSLDEKWVHHVDVLKW